MVDEALFFVVWKKYIKYVGFYYLGAVQKPTSGNRGEGGPEKTDEN
jgi:hypothetical protein